MTFLFFVDAVLLCFACVETLCALELVHRSDVFYSSMLQFDRVVQFSLRRSQWNGCATAARMVFSRVCSVVNRIVVPAWKLQMVLWQQIFSIWCR